MGQFWIFAIFSNKTGFLGNFVRDNFVGNFMGYKFLSLGFSEKYFLPLAVIICHAVFLCLSLSLNFISVSNFHCTFLPLLFGTINYQFCSLDVQEIPPGPWSFKNIMQKSTKESKEITELQVELGGFH
jgi:hypothetical protein